jgi:hypothetical protein
MARARGRAGLSTLLMTVGFWLACAAPARADGQVWQMASVTKTLAVDWRLNVDFAPRWERDASDYSRSVLRVQVARVLEPSSPSSRATDRGRASTWQ